MIALLPVGLITIASLVAQTPDVPAWQTAAGGRAEFEVASIKPTKMPKLPLFDLSNGNAKAPGGRFSAAFPLWYYITFAYKLSLTGDQTRAALAEFPKWVNIDMFDVDARAPGNPTKDQMRLMMQALLADRFKLKVHFEEREVPVYALTLATPGKTGPKLRPHSDGPPCPEPEAFKPVTQLPPKDAVFPATCDHDQTMGREDSTQLGYRNATMPLLANTVQNYGSLFGEVDRPVVDRTELKGTFDLVMQWSGRIGAMIAPGLVEPNPNDSQGPTFLQALRQQLGLKLVPARAAVRTIVIDHVERPTEN